MPTSYRVELAVSGRAGCQATECKHADIKIDKGDLRFGVWVEFEGGGSWRWKHWGCVTGSQLEHLRDKLAIPGKPNQYDWDALDGYDGDDKGSLSKDPALQEKVRRVVTQGFIDPEDFNGDPEMNRLGETGLHTAATKKRMREEKINRDHTLADLQEQLATLKTEMEAAKQAGKATTKITNQLNAVQEQLDEKSEGATPAKKKPAVKKRGRGAEDDSDEDSPKPTPVKKKRAIKAKKELDSDGEKVKPAPRKRIAKAKKEESDEEEAEDMKPAPKKRAPRIKKEEADKDGEEVKPAPKKRGSKKTAIKEEDEEMEEVEESKPAPAKKARGRKAAIKKEKEIDDEAVKQEESDEAEAPVAPKKRAHKGKKAVKEESADEAPMDEPAKPAPKKGGRKKKAVKKEEDSIKEESAEDTHNGIIKTEDDDVKDEPFDANVPSDIAMADIDSDPATKHEHSLKQDEAAAGEKLNIDSQPSSQVDPAETSEPAKPAREKGKGKKTFAAAAQTPTRGSRSRTASKA